MCGYKLCEACGKRVPEAPGYCILCGHGVMITDDIELIYLSGPMCGLWLLQPLLEHEGERKSRIGISQGQ